MKSKKNKDLAQELLDDLLDQEAPELPNQDKEDDVIEVEASPAEATADVYDFAQPMEKSEPTIALDQEEESTEVVDATPKKQEFSRTDETALDKDPSEDTKKIRLKTSVGRAFTHTKGTITTTSSGSENPLSRSENLRVAQEKILELESEIEKIREENIELAAAGETMMKKYDKAFSEKEEIRRVLESKSSQFESEVELLKDAIVSKDAQIGKLEDKNENMEAKIAANMQKIKVRERELENRLELVKMENAALLRNKNEMILDLKRNIDQLNLELEKYRKKGQDLNKQLEENKDVLNRTVKTLRIALTLLESGASNVTPLKKAK